MISESAARIVEQAILPVSAHLQIDFERAFDQARRIIASMPGFRGATLSRGVENPNSYLLLVEWDSIEDHEIGFRGSPEYQEWRLLLHHFYEPFPTVEHFVEVSRTAPGESSDQMSSDRIGSDRISSD